MKKLLILALLFGCGGADCPDKTSLSSSYQDVYAKVKTCAGLDGSDPTVVMRPTAPCPTSKLMRCLEDGPVSECPNAPGVTCGISGAYVPRCGGLIQLPDQWDVGLAHELIHHLLHQNNRQDWKEHSAPEFRCEVFRPE